MQLEDENKSKLEEIILKEAQKDEKVLEAAKLIRDKMSEPNAIQDFLGKE